MTLAHKLSNFIHLGKLPDEITSQLELDGGISYLQEGIKEVAILRDFKAPGIQCNYRRMSFIGFFALSPHRMVVRANFYHSIDINTAFNDKRFNKISFQADNTHLILELNASDFLEKSSGMVEVHLHLPEIVTPMNILKSYGANIK